jgi:DNA-binding XRE family transcriptional regulator
MASKKIPQNPIVSFRKALGLTRADLAKQADCSYSTLCQLELGYPVELTSSIVPILEKNGVDIEKAKAAYASWRKEVRTK